MGWGHQQVESSVREWDRWKQYGLSPADNFPEAPSLTTKNPHWMPKNPLALSLMPGKLSLLNQGTVDDNNWLTNALGRTNCIY
ncbi:hypothetical protein Y1Q_0020233 [Alligator mississippiensis]|uniref:Uncharacterized protein n=1 Tax=Alligator mississippiensis TaxID=8496 RepID=A0A151PIG4_ALLMI|nr:hypothetical protein Y1Q_0020233 [Alligator mississippiensis]